VDQKNPSSSHVPITFLRNYTDPLLESVSAAFVLSEAHPEPPVEVRESLCEPAGYMHDDYMADLFSGVFTDLYMDQDTLPSDPEPKPLSLPPSPPIQYRIEALLSLLMAQYQSNPNAFAFPTDEFPLDLARAVFTSNNVAEYVSAFFSYFHPHTPFIHRPSFDIQTVSLPLLLTISFLGSVFATPQDDALTARYFFDLGEEYIFGLLHQASTHSNYSIDESVQIVQAAVLIHALQMDSNNDSIRLRIRTHRFPAIVASMRRLDLFMTSRTLHSKFIDRDQFIIEETRIRYDPQLPKRFQPII
jgi:hypothetical protein